jgi:hypothetical protein
MSTADPARASGLSGTYVGPAASEYVEETSGDGWVTFAGVILLMVGMLNFVDGVAAISNSTFFTEDAAT